jgi:hypothetical protein
MLEVWLIPGRGLEKISTCTMGKGKKLSNSEREK